MSKKSKSVFVEAMEQRLLFDASALTETILSNTLPAAVSDQGVLHGTLSMSVANNSGFAEKDPGSIVSFVISSTPLNPPALNFYILKEQKATISLADGASKVFKFQINIPKGKLIDGAYTIYALIVDAGSDFSQSQPGSSLTIHPPIVTLSETESFVKLQDTATTGAKYHLTDKVAITDSGTDPSATALTIGIYATPDGNPADGSLMTSVTRKVVINAGKTVTVPVNVSALPALAVGTYDLITQVTQSNGTITQTDSSTAPTFTLTAPITGPQFSDSIVSVTPQYTPEPLDGAVQYLSELDTQMSIHNTGTAVNGDILFTLFASPNPTFDSSAMQVGQITLNLAILAKNGIRTFLANFGLNTDLNNYSDAGPDDYFYIQVTDPTGTVTMASWPTPISVGGDIVG